MSALNTALNLLKAFTPEKPSWGVRELSQWSGISSSTVQRVLATYCHQGLMRQNAVTRHYEIGIGFWHYGMLFRQHLRLDTLIAETVKNLAVQSGETAYCSMPDGEAAICVQLTESRQDIVIAIRLGERTPLHLGSRGKAILAWLPDQRRQAIIAERVTDPARRLDLEEQLSQLRQCGWILSRGERLPNITGISVPLLKATGEIFASLTIGGPSYRMSEQKVADCLLLLQHAKAQLELTLSHLE